MKLLAITEFNSNSYISTQNTIIYNRLHLFKCTLNIKLGYKN